MKFYVFLIISLSVIFAITPLGYFVVLDINSMTVLDENASEFWKSEVTKMHERNIGIVLVGIPVFTFCIAFMFWALLLREVKGGNKILDT